MYKRILVSTDGSRLSQKAVKAAARLAKACGARLAGIHVVPPYLVPVYSEGSAYGGLRVSRGRFKELSQKQARKILAAVEIEAETAGVPYSSVFATDPEPWRAILRAARSKKCDLIVMASHGRSGIAELLLGSETRKVLAHSKIPVLVYR
jgi:nucleotide-binding universal stress UspA family protein